MFLFTKHPVAVVFAMCLATPAVACWDTPTPSCFERQWQEVAVQVTAKGPHIPALYDLIDSGLVPPGAETAKTLLRDLSWSDLERYAQQLYAEETGEDPDVKKQPDPADMLKRLMGLAGSATDPNAHLKRPDPYYVAGIYRLAEQTQDTDLIAAWYRAIPNQIKVSEYLNAPTTVAKSNRTALPNEAYYDETTHTIATLAALQSGDLATAIDYAIRTKGEPRFFAWKAIARHAIDQDDMPTLRRAIDGMISAYSSPMVDAVNDETLSLLVAGAEENYLRSGDPDDLVHAYETADDLGEVSPMGWAAIYLADRILYQAKGASVYGAESFDLLAAKAKSSTDWGSFDDALMSNARTAWDLGLRDDALWMIDLAFEVSSGVPDLSPYPMPEQPNPLALAWLVEMQARFAHVRAHPAEYEGREYWDIWVDQNLHSAAHQITKYLSLYGRRDEARAFAESAAVHLKDMARRYPDALQNHQAFDGFLAEVAPWIYPAEQVLAMRQADPSRHHNGERPYAIAQDIAEAGDIEAAMTIVSIQGAGLSMPYWLALTDKLDDPATSGLPQIEIADYYDWLEHLVARQRLEFRAEYPILEEGLLTDMVVFWAKRGEWGKAKTYFDQLPSDPESGFRRVDAYQHMRIYQKILKDMTPKGEKQIEYPYEDFTL